MRELQKQKEIAISQMSRERQKLTDQRNDAQRKGLGKGATAIDFHKTLKVYGDIVNLATDSNRFISERL